MNKTDIKKELIGFLKKKGDEFVSGEEISSKLGFTRASVWKYMKKLKEEGFLIEAVPRRGYKLKKTPDKLYAYNVQDTLLTKVIGKEKIFHYDTLSSTNDKAYELAEDGEGEGTIIIAETQTNGKGRRGRKWVSPKGDGLYFSIILRPDTEVSEVAAITLVAAISTARAIKNFADLETKIKWPNDLLLNGRKICGILTEIKAEPDKIDFLVLGIGLNVNTTEDKLPPEGTSLREEGKKRIDRNMMLRALLEEFEKNYFLFQAQGFAPLIEECKNRSSVLGRPVKIEQHNKIICGEAIDIDETGALLVREVSGKVKRIFSGDIWS
ncbi:MAG: biotin--[acetyl-CoA-carboxylase] ligase [Candidatus Omnitrophota bacterium]